MAWDQHFPFSQGFGMHDVMTCIETQQQAFLERSPIDDPTLLDLVLALAQQKELVSEIGEQSEIVYIRQHDDLPMKSVGFG
jgi:hypothetical protein